MPYGTPTNPVAGTVITVAYAVANLLDPIRALRANTGAADPPAANRVAVSTGVGGPTSWQQVPTDAILDGAVTTAKLALLSVGSAQIGNGQVTTTKYGAASIDTAAIGNGQVTNAKMANNSVAAAQLVDGQVTTTKYAPASIDTTALGNAQVTTDKLADGAITSAKIADGTIATGDVADGAITSAKIADGTVATGELADGAVTSAKIADGTITDTDVAGANKDGAAGTASMRTLGSGGQQAAAGNHTHTSMAKSASGSYTGNGAASRAISGLGFAPKWVQIQKTNAQGAMILMGHDGIVLVPPSVAMSVGNSLDADGFTVLLGSGFNASGDGYIWDAFG